MHDAVAPTLESWASFYVIVGSSAGALTGLQFVVMTLIAGSSPRRTRGETISAFGTPNVVHFCAALLVAAILTVPWGSLGQAGYAVAICGLVGLGYSVVVLRRARRQSDYEPVFEDWLWHTLLPGLAYLAMLAAGVMLGIGVVSALFAIGAAALLLVFVGIHNAWDTVTYITVTPGLRADPPAPPAAGNEAGDGGATPRGAAAMVAGSGAPADAGARPGD